MKEDLLAKIRKELQSKKEEILTHNNKVKRIRELQKYKNVKEFLELSEIEYKQPIMRKIQTDYMFI